jgi:hypothetical protein
MLADRIFYVHTFWFSAYILFSALMTVEHCRLKRIVRATLELVLIYFYSLLIIAP